MGLLLSILNALSKNNSSSKQIPGNSLPPAIKEESFAGVALSEWNKLAKEVYRGLGCRIDQWGFLVFSYKSNRGHQTLKSQMQIKDGEMVNLGGHYSGQWWSAADEFAKIANQRFEFKE